MTSVTSNEKLEWVLSALAQNARQLERTGDSSWRFRTNLSSSFTVAATLESDWLVLSAHEALSLPADATSWDLLQRNAMLTGFVKFALIPNGSWQLRAELPLFEDTNIVQQVGETCAALDATCAFNEPFQIGSAPDSRTEQSDLKQLCTEAGWPFVERGPEKLLIELETSDQFRQASMIRSARGIHLSCELTTCDSAVSETRDAIALLLLTASGKLRLARTSIVMNVAQLEVMFPSPPCASEISGALESLSVGLQLCGEEIKMLHDPAIARRYLQLQGRRTGIQA